MKSVEIKMLGGGREVGRSAVALGYNGRYLLLDHGVNFTENDVPQFPQHIKPSLVEGIIISHAHLDHVGAAPLIYSSAKPPTITTNLSKPLIRVMVEDFLRISGYYIPYEYNELNTLLDNVIELSLNEWVELGDFKISLLNAGHIPGSAMALIELDGVRVLYTGDVNTAETKLVKPASYGGVSADILITEATYGNSLHPPRPYVEKELIDSILEVVENGGNVLIPVFSLGRAQELLCVLYQYLPGLNVYYDGMVRYVSEVVSSYPEYINMYGLLISALKKFNMVKTSGERRKLTKEKGIVIVASAGMLKGGPAQYYAKQFANNSKNGIFLVSYQARGTPGRKLLESGLLEDNGQLVKAKVKWFDFSSHADSEGLTNILRGVNNIKHVVVMHTEESVGREFIERLRKHRNDLSVYYPINGDTIRLDN
ncbi:MAG: MBL fold metallo-hydrolase [Sulfolobales archaeon]|nr:MBL fold metallo-hydrolase [Sulfolobales archaeon]MCX8185896.1 MBL fold metallo-hydrolase [Sulfolobales archaeon]MDW7969153.1 MBL fold metallo-hydrolase [Sulfolobales archaeon]